MYKMMFYALVLLSLTPYFIVCQQYKFSARMTASQYIAPRSGTSINFDTIEFDPNNNWSSTFHVYTVPVDGYYLACASTTLSSTSLINATLFINGGDTTEENQGVRISGPANTYVPATACRLVYRTAGNAIYCTLTNHATTAVQIIGDKSHAHAASSFCVHFLSLRNIHLPTFMVPSIEEIAPIPNKINTLIGCTKSLLCEQYKVSLRMNTSQFIGPKSGTSINFDTIEFDPNSNWSSTFHVYTIPIDGYYLACINTTLLSTGPIKATLFINGGDAAEENQGVRISGPANTYVPAAVCRLVYRTAGNAIYCTLTNHATAAVQIIGDTHSSHGASSLCIHCLS